MEYIQLQTEDIEQENFDRQIEPVSEMDQAFLLENASPEKLEINEGESMYQEESSQQIDSVNESSRSSRKRKRSPSHDAMMQPFESQMTLRKRAKLNYCDMIKPQVASKSIIGRQSEQQSEFSFGAQTGQVGGASFVRYDVIEKKG